MRIGLGSVHVKHSNKLIKFSMVASFKHVLHHTHRRCFKFCKTVALIAIYSKRRRQIFNLFPTIGDGGVGGYVGAFAYQYFVNTKLIVHKYMRCLFYL